MTIAKSTVASVVEDLEDFMATKSWVGARMGGAMVPHFLGDAGAAAATNAERIVWVPEWRVEEPVVQQEEEGHVCAEKDTACLVTCYAADFARLEQIVDGLTAALEQRVSHRGYAFEGRGKFGKPGATNAGYSFERLVVLRAPVFAALFVPGHVDTVTQRVAVFGDTNADPPETPDTLDTISAP